MKGSQRSFFSLKERRKVGRQWWQCTVFCQWVWRFGLSLVRSRAKEVESQGKVPAKPLCEPRWLRGCQGALLFKAVRIRR